MMVHNVFLYPLVDYLDVDAIQRFLTKRPDVLLDPVGTGTFLVCGVPEAKQVYRDRRVADPSRFPHAVLVTVKPDCMNVYQEYGDEDRLRSAREIVRWVIEHQRCRVEDEYREDWTNRVAHDGVRVLYPEQLA